MTDPTEKAYKSTQMINLWNGAQVLVVVSAFNEQEVTEICNKIAKILKEVLK